MNAKTIKVAPAPKAAPTQAAKVKAGLPRKDATVLIGLTGKLKGYNGMTCIEMQNVPTAITSMILVNVPEAAAKNMADTVIVAERNLVSSARAAAAAKVQASLLRERDAIIAYLEASGFKANGKDKWKTAGRETHIMVDLDFVNSAEGSLYVSVNTTIAKHHVLSVDYLDDEFDVATLKQFKSFMKNLFGSLVQIVDDKEFLNLVDVSRRLAAK